MPTQMIGIRTINNMPTMAAAQAHNLREHTSSNVDPSKSHLNEVLIDFPDGIRTTQEFYEKRVKESPYYDQSIPENKRHHIGERTVKAVELAFQVNNGRLNEKDFEIWKNETVRFCQDKFGKENIPYAVLHMDETTPHIHVLAIPINSDGKLSFRSIGSKKSDIWGLHQEYNDNYVGKLGIDMPNRLYGLISFERIAEFREHTIPKVEDISLSAPQKGETIEKYAQRVNEEHIAAMDGYSFALTQYESMKARVEALNKANRRLYNEKSQLEQKIAAVEKESLNKEIKERKETLSREYDLKNQGKTELLESLGIKNLNDIRDWKADSMETGCIMAGLDKIAESDPDRASNIYQAVMECMQIGEKELYIQNEMQKDEELEH